ncbi:bacteriophage abortive infection AbiH family protein [Acaryochloris marina]|uniref:Bacteriophage abortive infection AbiH n=1 Tax=Acaryochloris marina (strain MBIC 11017) TaxID=329726 RepID=B0CCK0_ACAM1|nr:bacteriophage abortive infection AbiH family protein [Acaryochloris marina]ABW28029.1 hypothetical protein AM1_3033 [Acaryochloris marina MBIC11017]BDM82742.1 hypothetical protein AM10699_56030 [Acaryochloris marina MBIC10699]
MNVVFILGNGFDLNLGLNTSYSDFYNYYKKQVSSNEVIKELKENIDSNTENWSDLELQLGRYTSRLKDQNDFDIFYFDIVDNLRDYLDLEEDSFDYSAFDKSVLLRDLVEPERVLSQRERNKLTDWYRKFGGNINTNILTFNYTQTIEKILGKNATSQPIGTNNKGVQVLLNSIDHIHGYLEDGLVLGVNDEEQIENEKLRLSQEVVEAIVKPMHNQELGHTRDDRCMQVISAANLIFVFGCSIGKSDQMWWEKVGSTLGESCRLVIFHRGSNVNSQNDILYARENRKIINRFLSLTNLDEEKRDIAKQYITAAVTKDLFKLVKST